MTYLYQPTSEYNPKGERDSILMQIGIALGADPSKASTMTCSTCLKRRPPPMSSLVISDKIWSQAHELLSRSWSPTRHNFGSKHTACGEVMLSCLAKCKQSTHALWFATPH